MPSSPKTSITSIEEWVFALLGFGSCFFTILVPLAVLVFFGWVIVRLMYFWGVI